jgi:hypothetical protein
VLCRLQHERGDWHVCIVLELADVERFKLAGPSIWDCIKHSMESNMRARVYVPRTAPEDDFQLPIRGGEPMVRWICMQVRHAGTCRIRALALSTGLSTKHVTSSKRALLLACCVICVRSAAHVLESCSEEYLFSACMT